MFSGIGIWEILLILLIILIVMGPDKIPDAARMLGKGMREVRRATNYFRDMFTLEEEPRYLEREDEALREHERRMRRKGGGGPVDQPMEEWEEEHGNGPADSPRGGLGPDSRPVTLDPPRGGAEHGVVELETIELTDTVRRIELEARMDVGH